MRGLAFGQRTGKISAKTAHDKDVAEKEGKWREFGGLGNLDSRTNIWGNVKGLVRTLSRNLNTLNQKNALRGHTFSIKLGTENVLVAGKEQQDLGWFKKLNYEAGQVLVQMFGEEINGQIEEVYKNANKRRSGESHTEYNDRIMKMMIVWDNDLPLTARGGFTDKYIQTGIDLIERGDKGKKTNKYLWRELKKTFGGKGGEKATDMRGFETEDKKIILGAYITAKELYKDTRMAQDLVNSQIQMFKGTTSSASAQQGLGPTYPGMNQDIFNVMDMYDFDGFGVTTSDSLNQYNKP